MSTEKKNKKHSKKQHSNGRSVKYHEQDDQSDENKDEEEEEEDHEDRVTSETDCESLNSEDSIDEEILDDNNDDGDDDDGCGSVSTQDDDVQEEFIKAKQANRHEKKQLMKSGVYNKKKLRKKKEMVYPKIDNDDSSSSDGESYPEPSHSSSSSDDKNSDLRRKYDLLLTAMLEKTNALKKNKKSGHSKEDHGIKLFKDLFNEDLLSKGGKRSKSKSSPRHQSQHVNGHTKKVEKKEPDEVRIPSKSHNSKKTTTTTKQTQSPQQVHKKLDSNDKRKKPSSKDEKNRSSSKSNEKMNRNIQPKVTNVKKNEKSVVVDIREDDNNDNDDDDDDEGEQEREDSKKEYMLLYKLLLPVDIMSSADMKDYKLNEILRKIYKIDNTLFGSLVDLATKLTKSSKYIRSTRQPNKLIDQFGQLYMQVMRNIITTVPSKHNSNDDAKGSTTTTKTISTPTFCIEKCDNLSKYEKGKIEFKKLSVPFDKRLVLKKIFTDHAPQEVKDKIEEKEEKEKKTIHYIDWALQNQKLKLLEPKSTDCVSDICIVEKNTDSSTGLKYNLRRVSHLVTVKNFKLFSVVTKSSENTKQDIDLREIEEQQPTIDDIKTYIMSKSVIKEQLKSFITKHIKKRKTAVVVVDSPTSMHNEQNVAKKSRTRVSKTDGDDKPRKSRKKNDDTDAITALESLPSIKRKSVSPIIIDSPLPKSGVKLDDVSTQNDSNHHNGNTPNNNNNNNNGSCLSYIVMVNDILSNSHDKRLPISDAVTGKNFKDNMVTLAQIYGNKEQVALSIKRRILVEEFKTSQITQS